MVVLMTRKRKNANDCEENTDKKMRLNTAFLRIENGLRIITPYFFTFQTNAKGRWLGRTLPDMWSAEFKRCSREYVSSAMRLGRIRVNNKRVDPEYTVCNNDKITHCRHKHESVVTSCSGDLIVCEDDDVLVLNKPSSWPVHPTGNYNYNSLTEILKLEHGRTNLKSVHRIDRLTSGVLIFAKHDESRRRLMEKIQKREAEKVYLAEVEGVFPENAECTMPLVTLSMQAGVQRVCFEREYKELTTLKDQQTPGNGLNGSVAFPKDAHTRFERLHTDGRTSIVKCMPITGRTHQIRVHLQYLGHPIVNDNIYNSIAFGERKGAAGEYGKSLKELVSDVINDHHAEKEWFTKEEDTPDHIVIPEDCTNIDELAEEAQRAWSDPWQEYDKFCPECHLKRRMPRQEELVMHLHSWKYTLDDSIYETPMPQWARRFLSNRSAEETKE